MYIQHRDLSPNSWSSIATRSRETPRASAPPTCRGRGQFH